jgi:hypothetical protein
MAVEARGNPYFAALAGNSILMQGHGETTLEKLVAPALKYAVETRRGSN